MLAPWVKARSTPRLNQEMEDSETQPRGPQGSPVRSEAENAYLLTRRRDGLTFMQCQQQWPGPRYDSIERWREHDTTHAQCNGHTGEPDLAMCPSIAFSGAFRRGTAVEKCDSGPISGARRDLPGSEPTTASPSHSQDMPRPLSLSLCGL